MLFDGSRPLDVARSERLYTWRQRVALAARDGGCLFPECDRPPAWCEAHHIDFWARDGGKTDVARGVLLCRHHHLLMHNNGWEIIEASGEYSFLPPASIDAQRVPIPAQRR